MKKAIIIFLPIVAVAAIALSWWLFYHERQPVKLAELRLMELHTSVNTNGIIEADRVYELRSQVSGICRRILAREGMILKQGEPILEIDSESFRADLSTAAAELAAAELDLADVQRGPKAEELSQAEAEASRARLEVEHTRSTFQTNEWLLQRNAVSKYEVEQSRRELVRAQRSLEAAESRREALKARFGKYDRARAEARITAARSRVRYLESIIAKSTLRAPADGTLFQFTLKDGAYVTSTDLVGLLADLSRLRLKAFVDEPDLTKVSLGAEVAISWNAQPQKRWKARIDYLPSQVVPRGNRSVAEALCTIENPISPLIPNVHVDVEILMVREPQVPALPRDVVFSEGRTQYVWAPRDEVAKKVVVQTGRSTSTLIEITRGLSLGDKVIVPENTPITEGMQLRIVE